MKKQEIDCFENPSVSERLKKYCFNPVYLYSRYGPGKD